VYAAFYIHDEIGSGLVQAIHAQNVLNDGSFIEDDFCM